MSGKNILTTARVCIIMAHSVMYYLLGSSGHLSDRERFYLGAFGGIIAVLTPILAAADPSKAITAELAQLSDTIPPAPAK